jgi:hypothetical protein
MKASEFITNTIPFTILLITLSSIRGWTSIPLLNTTFWWILQAYILYLFFKGKSVIGKQSTENAWPISIFLIVVLASFVYGCFVAEYYWDWKVLIQNFMVFLMLSAIYAYSSPVLLKRTFQVWFRYALLLFPILLPFIEYEGYGRYLVPIGILLLFFPNLPFKWKIIGIGALLFVVIFSPDARSNSIKMIIPFLVSFLYYFKKIRNIRIRKRIFYSIALVLLISPFVLFGLAVSNAFNVFNMSEYMAKWSNIAEVTRPGDEGSSLLDDTRTFIYEEEIYSAIKNDYWFVGRSMARGYDSIAFADTNMEVQNDTKRFERSSSEVSIMNVFNYFGLIGVFSYFMIFVVASYKAIFKSNNINMNLIGVYVAFRWLYAWVEDFNIFDLNYLFLWVVIGMCFSKPFKNMNDVQFDIWVKSIFDKSKNNLKKNYRLSTLRLKSQF